MFKKRMRSRSTRRINVESLEPRVLLDGLPASVRITELMYNPSPATAAEIAAGYVTADFEYIELTNIGTQTQSWDGLQFTDGVTYSFPGTIPGTSQPMDVAPGQCVVVVNNTAAFHSRYSSFSGVIAGEYTGNLNDTGEAVELDAPDGTPIHQFSYGDGWYPISDGDGFSLTIRDPLQDVLLWDDNDGWRASAAPGGTPGSSDSLVTPGSVVIHEVLPHSDEAYGDVIELFNTTSQAVDIGGWYLSDGGQNLMKYRFHAGTTIQPGGYLVLTQAAHFGIGAGDAGSLVGFGLSEYGESVYLSSAAVVDGISVAGGYREHVDFGDTPLGHSMGLFTKSTGNTDFTLLTSPTFGTQQGSAFPGAANSAPVQSPLVINEIQYHPSLATAAETAAGYLTDDFEYVEIYNRSGAAIPLNPNPYLNLSQNRYALTGGIGFTFGWLPADLISGQTTAVWSQESGATATWSTSGLSGTYQVYATYKLDDPSGKVRDLDDAAEYTIHSAGGSQTVVINQDDTLDRQLDADSTLWVDLGSYAFSGAGSVVLARSSTAGQADKTFAGRIVLRKAGQADVVLSAPAVDSPFIQSGITNIPAGGYLVVACNKDAFNYRYDNDDNHIRVAGSVSRHLRDSGDEVNLSEYELIDADAINGYIPTYKYDHVSYSDGPPNWPAEPDGTGPSLERIQFGGYGNEPANWATSAGQGTPGAINRPADVTPPTVAITAVSPDPRNLAAGSVAIVFSEAILGLDLADLMLKRDGGSNLLTASQTLTSTDNITWTLGNLSGLTASAGSYSLTLSATGSGIVDMADNALTAGSIESWTMDTQAPSVTAITATAAPDAHSLTFDVAFSEAVQNLSTDDFQLTKTGTAAGTIASVSAASGTSVLVTINAISGAGTLRLDLKSGTNVQDPAGNAAGLYSSAALVQVPADIRMASVFANGAAQVVVTYEILGSPVIPFAIGFYRSTDATYGSGDVRTGIVSITDAADLTAGLHTKTFAIGGGAGAVALPGAGAEENSFEYYVLGVADCDGAVNETGSSGGETNNTAALAGVYHLAGGAVLAHGTSAADTIQILPGSVQVVANGTTFSYPAADVSGVRARGHAGDDQLEFTCGAGFGAAAGTTLDFLFVGGAGTNTAKFWGSTSAGSLDTANLNPTYTSITGPGYYILAKDLAGSTFSGQGGPDKAYLNDSAGNDTLSVHPTYATLSNSTATFTNRVENCPNVYGKGLSTGTDTAHFYAGTGNGLDLFSGSPTYATMTGPTGTGRTYYSRADGFETLLGDSSDGVNDVATLFDSELTTTTTQYAFTLDAGNKYGLIQNGSSTSIRANGFFTTVTGTRDQGADTATLVGSSSADTIQAKMNAKEVWLVPTAGATGAGFKYRASQVVHVEATSTDALDTAEFYDSVGNDAFTGGPGSGQMVTPGGVSVSATGFRYVTAYSKTGGTDTAVLSGRTGSKDYFVGQPTQATLGDSSAGTGTTYFDWLTAFESVAAAGQLADGDTATLTGKSGADTFTSDFRLLSDGSGQRDPSRPFASVAGTGYSNTVDCFQMVTATGDSADVAYLYAAATADVFSATPTSAVMSRKDATYPAGLFFYYQAKSFGTVHARWGGAASSGATAKLSDAALHVLLEVSGSTAELSNLDSTSGPFAVQVEDFAAVLATASAGNAYAKKQVAVDHVLSLTLSGPWQDG